MTNTMPENEPGRQQIRRALAEQQEADRLAEWRADKAWADAQVRHENVPEDDGTDLIGR